MNETITLQGLTYGSAAIGKSASGKAVFVERGCPGDTVEVTITEENASYCRGEIVSIVEAGPARVQPTCPYQEQCGGCSWMHVDYATQLDAKRANVIEQLVRTARIPRERAEEVVWACRPSKRQLGYRNKLELSAGLDASHRFQLGLHRRDTQQLLACDTCLLAARGIEKAPRALRGALRFLQGKRDLGIFRVGVRHSMRTGDTEIALWTPPSSFPRKMVADTLTSALSCTSIVRIMAHPGKERKIKGVEVLQGKGYWSEEMYGQRFKVSAPSFFQVNTAQAEHMIATVCEELELSLTSTVADLYCGAGSFTLALAKQTEWVCAVEAASSAVRDLRRNLDEAHLGNVDVIGGDSAREIRQLTDIDALLVDPPRAGLAKGVAQDIAATSTRELAYVSCDPATLARDVARLSEVGFTLTKTIPFDLFPQTHHVETASFFHREQGK